MTRRPVVLLLSIALSAGSCATTSGRRQIDGFSIEPPQGQGWTLGAEPERGLLAKFAKGYRETGEPRSVVAMVTRKYLALPSQQRTQLLHQLVESLEGEWSSEARYRRLAFEASEDQSLGAVCVRYSATVEDRGVPSSPSGSVFILSGRGVRCVHPDDPHFVLDISYSQRFPQEQQWDPAFDGEVEPFLRSIRPVSLPVSERRWEPARWQRTMVAAQQAKERGNASEAERLCVEALQYVDASAVRSLYEYASLLQALKRDEAEAARARADKLREAKTQPGSSVYLGWIPSTELQAYAGLVQELSRGAEAEAMQALADAYDGAQRAHFTRLMEQARGGDPRGRC